MKYVLFSFGLLFWLTFAYDIECDRDLFTWIWLLMSIFAFISSYLIYNEEEKKK